MCKKKSIHWFPCQERSSCFVSVIQTEQFSFFCFVFVFCGWSSFPLFVFPLKMRRRIALTNPIRYQTSLNIISNVHDCLPEFRSHGRCSSWCTEPCPGAEAVVLMAPRPLCVDIWPTERPSAIPSLFGQFNSLLVPRVRGKEVDCGCKYAINTVAHGNSHEGLANCLACFYEVG